MNGKKKKIKPKCLLLQIQVKKSIAHIIWFYSLDIHYLVFLRLKKKKKKCEFTEFPNVLYNAVDFLKNTR